MGVALVVGLTACRRENPAFYASAGTTTGGLPDTDGHTETLGGTHPTTSLATTESDGSGSGGETTAAVTTAPVDTTGTTADGTTTTTDASTDDTGDTSSSSDASTGSSSSSTGEPLGACEALSLEEGPPPFCSMPGMGNEVTFVNNCDERVLAIYWVSFTCDETPYGIIAPGQELLLFSYANHPWRIRDADTQELMVEIDPLPPDDTTIYVP